MNWSQDEQTFVTEAVELHGTETASVIAANALSCASGQPWLCSELTWCSRQSPT